MIVGLLRLFGECLDIQMHLLESLLFLPVASSNGQIFCIFLILSRYLFAPVIATFLLAGAVILQHRIVPVPANDLVLHQIAPVQQRVLDEVPLLESLQHLQRLAAEPQPKRLCQFSRPADA